MCNSGPNLTSIDAARENRVLTTSGTGVSLPQSLPLTVGVAATAHHRVMHRRHHKPSRFGIAGYSLRVFTATVSIVVVDFVLAHALS